MIFNHCFSANVFDLLLPVLNISISDLISLLYVALKLYSEAHLILKCSMKKGLSVNSMHPYLRYKPCQIFMVSS